METHQPEQRKCKHGVSHLEGHQACDGCCNPTPQPAWEEEFDSYIRLAPYEDWDSSKPFSEYIKEFISHILKEERNATLREVMEALPSTVHFWGDEGLEKYSKGFNECLEEVSKIIQQKLTSEHE